MKTLKNFTFFLFASFILAACGGNSPDSVAIKYVEAINEFDIQSARKYVSTEVNELLNQMDEIYSKEEIAEMKKQRKEDNKGVKVKVSSSKVSDDGLSAVVEIEESKDDQSRTSKMKLIKEEGEWKISEPYYED